jgi:hypothetical protein
MRLTASRLLGNDEIEDEELLDDLLEDSLDCQVFRVWRILIQLCLTRSTHPQTEPDLRLDFEGHNPAKALVDIKSGWEVDVLAPHPLVDQMRKTLIQSDIGKHLLHTLVGHTCIIKKQ